MRTFMALALLAAGCIVADPPTFSDPDKTPPVLLLNEADPPVYQVRLLDQTSEPRQVQINVPVRSEDAGDPLIGALYLNWNVAGGNNTYIQGTQRRLDPSTFDDTGRNVATLWDYGLEKGCKQVTLVVTHETNFDWLRSSYINPDDIAIATWFFNVADDPLGTNALSGCPSSPGASQ